MHARSKIRSVAVLALIGTPFYVICSLYHYCKCGHLQHGPYPWYYWVNDVVWAACFIAVLVFSLNLRAKRRMWFSYANLFLLIFVFAGLGDVGLPLLIIMDIYAILYLVIPDKYVIHNEPTNKTENTNKNPEGA